MGKKKKKVDMRKGVGIQQNVRPMMEDRYNCSRFLSKEEEEEIMKSNHSLVSLFEVRVEKILERYKLDPKSYQKQAQSRSSGSLEEEGSSELLLKESKVLRRVPEDQLEDMNMGT